ncbi:MAG: hypothetical protein LBD01_06065 [Puniceicoccales bacterium]|nr:hypothetical protein [Puniceicoccales bacterium]
MKSFKLAALAAIVAFTAAAAVNASQIPVPGLKVRTTTTSGLPAGDWKASADALDYKTTRESAEKAEKAGDIAAALTFWERVLDRTTCTERERAAARARVKELRPKVQANTDSGKARPWRVLALVYAEVKGTKTDDQGKTTEYHRVMDERDKTVIGRALGGFRDLVFEYSSGVLLPEIDIELVTAPITKIPVKSSDFILGIHDVAVELKNVEKRTGKKYDTVIGYVKYKGGEGPDIPRPRYIAATYGRLRELGDAGYVMIPWGTHFPIRNEEEGEAELHEWLHQMDDVIHKNLGYPYGAIRNPDDGQRDPEYTRPSSAKSWAHFYRYLMAEHATRQIWSEVTIQRTGPKPGKVITTIKD